MNTTFFKFFTHPLSSRTVGIRPLNNEEKNVSGIHVSVDLDVVNLKNDCFLISHDTNTNRRASRSALKIYRKQRAKLLETLSHQH